MTGYLEPMVAATRARLAKRKQARPLSSLEREAKDQPRPRGFQHSLQGAAVGVIAEFKRRSPSAGAISADLAVSDVCAAYERGGATAVSVLTDEEHFGGSLADLEVARRFCDLPLLRKDFCIDGYQVYESRAAGADALLLVVATLEPALLAELLQAGSDLGLDCLVEVHDRDELSTALELGARLIGINNRNLRDLSVDVTTTFDLLREIPQDATVVSESGIQSRLEVLELERAGVDAVLIGESLMRAEDPEAACREFSGHAGV